MTYQAGLAHIFDRLTSDKLLDYYHKSLQDNSKAAQTLALHDELRWRQHRGHSLMLPASSSPPHTALAGSPFLCACAADGDDFVRISRTLRSRSVRAIARFGSWGSLRICARLSGVCRLCCGLR